MRSDGCIECGECCTHMVIPIPPDDGEDYYLWFELHGLEVFKRLGGHAVKVPIPCGALTADGKCGIYEFRPKMCQVWVCNEAEGRVAVGGLDSPAAGSNMSETTEGDT